MNFSSLGLRRPLLGGSRALTLSLLLILSLVATIVAYADDVPPEPPAAYSVTVSPGTCEADLPCSLTFEITNSSPPTSSSLLTTATVTAPAGFDVTDVGDVSVTEAPPVLVQKTWEGSETDNVVTLTADEQQVVNGLAPTESLSVVVTVVAPQSTVGPVNVFTTDAFGFLLPALDPVEFELEGTDPSVAVVDDEAQCLDQAGCTTREIVLNNTRAFAEAPAGLLFTTQFLLLSLGDGYLDGGSYETSQSKCLTTSTFTRVGEAVTTELSPNDPAGRSHIVTLTLDKTGPNSPGAPGAERIQICAISDGPFPGAGAEPNGKTGLWEGLLQDCPAIPVTKCVLSRSRNAGKTVIRYFVEPGDPISIPGVGDI
jgi:hypothetical protein